MSNSSCSLSERAGRESETRKQTVQSDYIFHTTYQQLITELIPLQLSTTSAVTATAAVIATDDFSGLYDMINEEPIEQMTEKLLPGGSTAFKPTVNFYLVPCH